MPLDIPQAPQAVGQALQLGMQRLPARTKNTFSTAAVGGAPSSASLPHEVFVMNTEDVVGGAGLDASRPAGWRYIVEQPAAGGGNGTARAAAEITSAGGAPKLSHLQHGWIGDATLQAVQAAAARPEVVQGSFDLRMLRVPSLLVDALWLKNKGAGQDLVMPIASRDNAIRPQQLYRADDFLEQLRRVAANKVPFDNAPPAGR